MSVAIEVISFVGILGGLAFWVALGAYTWWLLMDAEARWRGDESPGGRGT